MQEGNLEKLLNIMRLMLNKNKDEKQEVIKAVATIRGEIGSIL